MNQKIQQYLGTNYMTGYVHAIVDFAKSSVDHVKGFMTPEYAQDLTKKVVKTMIATWLELPEDNDTVIFWHEVAINYLTMDEKETNTTSLSVKVAYDQVEYILTSDDIEINPNDNDETLDNAISYIMDNYHFSDKELNRLNYLRVVGYFAKIDIPDPLYYVYDFKQSDIFHVLFQSSDLKFVLNSNQIPVSPNDLERTVYAAMYYVEYHAASLFTEELSTYLEDVNEFTSKIECLGIHEELPKDKDIVIF